MIDVKVIDNFLTKQEHQDIYKELSGETGFFPWFYSDNVNDNNDPKDQFQFCHQFYNMVPNSQYFNLVKPIINKLNMTAVAKIKANLLLKTKTPIVFGYHSDYNWTHKWWTAIYYVNSNNGKTIFTKNKKNVTSKANRLLMFDGRLKHCGTTSTNSKQRIIINFNFFNQNMGK
jgi:hypothetical protein